MRILQLSEKSMETFEGQKGNNPEEVHYSIILFVINNGINSRRARKNLERLCEEWLPSRHKIEIVDVVKDFQTALDYDILLTPSVVVTDPKPRVTIHGDLSDASKFIDALNLEESEKDE